MASRSFHIDEEPNGRIGEAEDVEGIARRIEGDRKAVFRLANRESPSSDFFEPPGRVLVQNARDQRLIGQPLGERPLLNRLQVLARQADVQSTVFVNVAFA
jgi:hypothetical protein